MDKKEIRKSLIAKRKEITKNDKVKFDNHISSAIINLPEFELAKDILLFAPQQFEFNTELIALKAINLNKNIYFPKCIDDKGNMIFFKVENKNDMVKGMYNIMEPKSFLEEYSDNKESLCIVPALSTDNNFYRIGYGKGYYDRFLCLFSGISVCPCYSVLLYDKLPTNKYDKKIDIIVTENEVRRSHFG